MMDDYWGRSMNNGYGIWGFIFMLTIMVLVIAGVIAVVHYLNHDTREHNQGESALDLLKKRYANGEIDKKEYEEKRKVLND